MTPTPRTPVFRAAAAALAAAAVVALSPGRASAGCGDYVSVGGNPRPGHPAADPAAAGDPARTPCDGPFCSGRPTTPTPPPATPAGGPSGGPEWAAADAPRGPTAADGFGQPVPAPAAGVPAHSPQPVFHPPRAR